MTEEEVSRQEYEQFTRTYELRHSELRLEIKELETDLKSDMNGLKTKLDALSTQVSNKSADGWKIAVSALTSLVVGYIAGILQHLVK